MRIKEMGQFTIRKVVHPVKCLEGMIRKPKPISVTVPSGAYGS